MAITVQGARSSVHFIKENVNFSFSVRMAARARRTAAEIAQLLIANVDSDESGSDEENEKGLVYDPSPAVSDEEESTDESEIPFERESTRRNVEARELQFTSSDGTHWTQVDIGSVTNRGREPARNIVRQRPGATRFILNRVDNEEDIFIELLGHDNILRILDFTRAEAKRQGNDEFEISENDLYAFFGLCIIRGVLRGKNEPLSSFWSQEFGINVFKETMSRNRFKDIKRYIRFDDKTTRSQRRGANKFAAIQELWESAMKRRGDAFFLANIPLSMNNYSHVSVGALSCNILAKNRQVWDQILVHL